MRAIKLLVGIILFEAAVWGGLVTYASLAYVYTLHQYYAESQMYQAELKVCEGRKDALLKAIKVEGLWKRLDLHRSQAWLVK